MTDQAGPTEESETPDPPGVPDLGETSDPRANSADLERTDPDAPEERPLSPLAALAEKHRFVLGVSIAVIMVGVGAWAALTFVPENPIPGAFGLIQRYSFPTMCALIAVVGTTWACRVRRMWTNIAAYAAIATYIVYILTGWIYEHFIA